MENKPILTVGGYFGNFFLTFGPDLRDQIRGLEKERLEKVEMSRNNIWENNFSRPLVYGDGQNDISSNQIVS